MYLQIREVNVYQTSKSFMDSMSRIHTELLLSGLIEHAMNFRSRYGSTQGQRSTFVSDQFNESYRINQYFMYHYNYSMHHS